MGLTGIIIFVVLFAIVAGVGIMVTARTTMSKRVEDVVAGREQDMTLDLSRDKRQGGAAITSFLERVGTSVPQDKKGAITMRESLIRAGYREPSAVNVMYGVKIMFPVVLLMIIIFAWHTSNVFPYIIAGGVGYLLPDLGLQRLIRMRQNKIRKGLPDALDLLVICVEAGLSLDQALARSAGELSVVHPELSDELNLVVLEQAAGGGRSDAWRHLADRTGVDNVRHLVATIIQAEQFGTSIAKTLRVHSDTMRLKRKQTLEEQAAKTTVKIVFPLVFFIFPSIMLVTLGPAALQIMKEMPALLNK